MDLTPIINQIIRITIQPHLTRRLLMRPKPKIPRVARNDKVR